MGVYGLIRVFSGLYMSANEEKSTKRVGYIDGGVKSRGAAYFLYPILRRMCPLRSSYSLIIGCSGRRVTKRVMLYHQHAPS